MKNNFVKKQFSTETVHLGSVLHACGNQLVLKLEHQDIPYPNSAVLYNKKQIGKIDEIFGSVDDVYASVTLEKDGRVEDYGQKEKMEGYRDRFLSKSRFLPREDVERKKEKDDQRKQDNGKRGKFNSRGGSFNNKGKGGGNFNNRGKGSGGFNDRGKSSGNYSNRGDGFSNKGSGNFGNKGGNSFNNKRKGDFQAGNRQKSNRTNER